LKCAGLAYALGWIGLMTWLLLPFLVVIGAPVFMRAYRRRLEVLKSPWIIGETVRRENKDVDTRAAPAASEI